MQKWMELEGRWNFSVREKPVTACVRALAFASRPLKWLGEDELFTPLGELYEAKQRLSKSFSLLGIMLFFNILFKWLRPPTQITGGIKLPASVFKDSWDIYICMASLQFLVRSNSWVVQHCPASHGYCHLSTLLPVMLDITPFSCSPSNTYICSLMLW